MRSVGVRKSMDEYGVLRTVRPYEYISTDTTHITSGAAGRQRREMLHASRIHSPVAIGAAPLDVEQNDLPGPVA